MNNDTLLLNQAYTEIELQQLVNESILDTLTNLGHQASQKIQGASDALAALPDQVKQLQQWASVDIPTYIQHLGPYLAHLSVEFGSGALATKIAGQGLMLFAKKLNKEAQKNKETLISMLPKEVKAKIKQIEDLQRTNPKEFMKQKIIINRNAYKELERAFKQAGFNTKDPIISKLLNWIGQLLNSTVGSLAGGSPYFQPSNNKYFYA